MIAPMVGSKSSKQPHHKTDRNREMFLAWQGGEPIRSLARRYGLSFTRASQIVHTQRYWEARSP